MMKHILFAVAAIALSWPAQAELCPLDHLVFQNRETSREFAAERVAADYGYLCDDGKIIHSRRPRPDLQSCRQFGTTLIEGYLSGEKVYAIYSVIVGSPCCSWDSFPSYNEEVTRLARNWLPIGLVPRIDLSSKHDIEWNTIEDNGDEKVHGPLGGGSFKPVFCRHP